MKTLFFGLGLLALAFVLFSGTTKQGSAGLVVASTMSAEEVATLTTAEYRIELRIPPNSFRRYSAENFTVWRNGKFECILNAKHKCIRDYTGVAQSVEWFISRADGGLVPQSLALREHVGTLPTDPSKQNTWLPRPDFNLTIPTQRASDGKSALASDFQSSGYSIPQMIDDEQSRCSCRLSPEQIEALRDGIGRDFAAGESWFRQEVFIVGQQIPFAVLIWHHTANNVQLTEVYDRFGQQVGQPIASLGR